MKKKLLGILIYGGVVLSLTGCGNSAKEVNVVDDLNKIYSDCLSQNEDYTCKMNWTLQSYLETYSSYQLLNTSDKEFTVKPQAPNSLFTYGTSRDSMCAYDYACLLYTSPSPRDRG